MNKDNTEGEKSDDSNPKQKERAGVVLKKAREAQGLSLEIVHEATKIPLDVLRAIEEGYKVRVLSPFYYTGFIKMYANYLNVDIAEVVDDYKQEILPGPMEPDLDEFEMPQWVSRIFTRERKQQIVIVAVILLAVFLLSKIFGIFTSQKPETPREKEVLQVESVKREIKVVAETSHDKVRQKPPKIVAPKITVKVQPKVKPVKKAKVAPRVPKPIKSTKVIAPVVAQRNISLSVRANQNSWLRVKTDGNVVFQSTLRTGAVETWLADDEIEISGRNINQLEFELNGKMIGTLGRKDRNAKKVVITKNGLSVKK